MSVAEWEKEVLRIVAIIATLPEERQLGLPKTMPDYMVSKYVGGGHFWSPRTLAADLCRDQLAISREDFLTASIVWCAQRLGETEAQVRKSATAPLVVMPDLARFKPWPGFYTALITMYEFLRWDGPTKPDLFPILEALYPKELA